MNKILIREMAEVDLTSVCGLAEQLGYPISLESLSQRFLQLIKLPDHKLFVACNDNKVIGWIHVGREMSSLLSTERADVGALIVDSQFRSQGLGASLMKAAEIWAKENNLNLMRVRSNVKRTEAHRFYLNLGYKQIKSWHLFNKELS